MSAEVQEPSPLPIDLQSLVTKSKVMVVGAGGIGCELLKNLVLTGFKHIHVIDLDTIDVSNLNRQFLFRREHVGQSKALVAKDSVLAFNPDVHITAIHDSITESKYDLNFYKQFSLVMNALDNKGARSHVNRMCLAANICLIESGSAGYRGNVALHKKGVSECYDCTVRPHQKSFPGCTIRNTPSEPIHCIVWAKHLFNQLFGLADADEDVSPDSEDPDAVGDAGKVALEMEMNGSSSIQLKKSTRQWARDVDYDAKKLFHKFFNEDIKYLLSMENLWQKRRPPTALVWDALPMSVETNIQGSHNVRIGLKDQRIWSLTECAKIFQESTFTLKTHLERKDELLIWDKDDDPAMDFVTACANIRSYIFGIQEKSRFDIKSMAGNIIPAIPSTNAIVAGFIVLHAFNVLRQQYYKCPTFFINNRPTAKKVLFPPDAIMAPNPKCFVCAEKPEIVVKLDPGRMTVRMLGEILLKKELNMVAPDVEIDDGQGTILISSEDGETDDIADTLLKEFNVRDGTRLKCDDFLQSYQLNITVVEMKSEDEMDKEKNGELFLIIGDRSVLGPKESKTNGSEDTNSEPKPGSSSSFKNSKDVLNVVEDDEDLLLIDPELEEVEEMQSPNKGKRSSSMFPQPPALPVKKRRIGESVERDGEDVYMTLSTDTIEFVHLD